MTVESEFWSFLRGDRVGIEQWKEWRGSKSVSRLGPSNSVMSTVTVALVCVAFAIQCVLVLLVILNMRQKLRAQLLVQQENELQRKKNIITIEDVEDLAPEKAYKAYEGAADEENGSVDFTCAICIEEGLFGEPIRTLPCHHNFHSTCVTAWLMKSNSCPLCKRKLLVLADDVVPVPVDMDDLSRAAEFESVRIVS